MSSWNGYIAEYVEGHREVVFCRAQYPAVWGGDGVSWKGEYLVMANASSLWKKDTE